MKKLITAVALVAAAIAVAGDDPVTQVSYTGTQGCTAALQPKKKYAVQCTTDCYVRVTSDTTNAPATTNSVLVSAGKLYDTPTTASQVYICAIQSAASGSLKVFLNRGPTE